MGEDNSVSTQTEPSRKKQRPKTNENCERRPRSKDTGRQFSIEESLPPLSNLDAIFHDMVQRAWEKIPLTEATEVLPENQMGRASVSEEGERISIGLRMGVHGPPPAVLS